MTASTGEHSVCQFFKDGSHEYVRRCVGAEEAVRAFQHYCTSIGARLGTTVRVILTDGDDCVNMEWKREQGITFASGADKWIGWYRDGVR